MLLEWDESMSVENDDINDEHRKLISFLNELYGSVENDDGRDALVRCLSKAIGYAQEHFVHEEKLFSQTAYPDKEAHIAEHRKIQEKLLALQKRIQAGDKSGLGIDFMINLKEWLVDHIEGMDMKYVPYLPKNENKERAQSKNMEAS